MRESSSRQEEARHGDQGGPDLQRKKRTLDRWPEMLMPHSRFLKKKQFSKFPAERAREEPGLACMCRA